VNLATRESGSTPSAAICCAVGGIEKAAEEGRPLREEGPPPVWILAVDRRGAFRVASLIFLPALRARKFTVRFRSTKSQR
jgi:hypothetical protein